MKGEGSKVKGGKCGTGPAKGVKEQNPDCKDLSGKEIEYADTGDKD